VYPYHGFSLSNALAGGVAGFFIGLFVGGFEGLVKVVFAGVSPIREDLLKPVGATVDANHPKQDSRVDRALVGIGRATLRRGMGLATLAISAFAGFGLLMGVFLFATGTEVFSFFSYYHAARMPDGCPNACASQTFRSPFGLWGRSLRGADLTDADLSGSMTFNVDFRDSTLVRVNLSQTLLAGSRFDGANLTAGRLERAVLSGTSFVGADLTNVDLTGADLRDADLRATRVGGLRIGQAWYNARTRWPDGFDPARAGARLSTAPAGSRPDAR
jgi:hypothetical protein